MTAAVYGTSAIKRNRRSKVELEVLEAAIYEVAAAERPCTIRGVFYRVMSKGLVPESEQGYRVVQNRILLMRRSGALPYNWISDGTRWRIKPETFSSLDKALRDTATFYRRALWDDQDVHINLVGEGRHHLGRPVGHLRVRRAVDGGPWVRLGVIPVADRAGDHQRRQAGGDLSTR